MLLLMKEGVLTLPTAIETCAFPPGATEKVAPFGDVRLKVSVVAVTVRLTVAVVFDELVGVILIVVGPDGAMLGSVEIVTVTGGALAVPVKVTLAGLKLQVAPAGRPVQLLGLKFTTVPTEPVTGAMVKVALADCPAEMGLGARVVAVSAKSGVRKAFQAIARLLASTEPRPVTRLYFVVVSKLEALKPITPPAGHCRAAGWIVGVPTWQYTMLSPLVTVWKTVFDGVAASV